MTEEQPEVESKTIYCPDCHKQYSEDLNQFICEDCGVELKVTKREISSKESYGESEQSRLQLLKLIQIVLALIFVVMAISINNYLVGIIVVEIIAHTIVYYGLGDMENWSRQLHGVITFLILVHFVFTFNIISVIDIGLHLFLLYLVYFHEGISHNFN